MPKLAARDLADLQTVDQWRNTTAEILAEIEDWRDAPRGEHAQFGGRSREPRGFRLLTTALTSLAAERLPSINPEPLAQVHDIIRNWCSGESRKLLPARNAIEAQASRALDIAHLIEAGIMARAEGKGQAPAKRQRRPRVESVAKRAWTQPDLDTAIREYLAKRADHVNRLIAGIKARKPNATAEARRVFGRNPIARALGVKSPVMVSKSKPWQTLAIQLDLTQERKAKGTRHTAKPGRVGYDIAIEQASSAASRESMREARDTAPDDDELQRLMKEPDPDYMPSPLDPSNRKTHRRRGE
ncbi:MAG: hypothetical protein NTW19_02720 [Planctomycetota bacterium]|nr:hypothetical protein [Planctomycetota bacterium]